MASALKVVAMATSVMATVPGASTVMDSEAPVLAASTVVMIWGRTQWLDLAWQYSILGKGGLVWRDWSGKT